MSESKSNSKAVTTNEEAATDQPEMKMTGIMVTKESFTKTYVVLRGATEGKVPVSSVSRALPVLYGSGEQVFDDQDDRALEKHIINLKAIAGENVDAVRDLFKGREEIDLGELRGLTLSYNAIIPASGEMNLPFKGQNIIAKSAYYTSADGERQVLGIETIAVPVIAQAASFSFEDEVIEAPAEEETK